MNVPIQATIPSQQLKCKICYWIRTNGEPVHQILTSFHSKTVIYFKFFPKLVKKRFNLVAEISNFTEDFGASASYQENITESSDQCLFIEFKVPERNSISQLQFMMLHPIHPASCKLSSLFVREMGNVMVPRNWLSYNTFNDKYYCSICMAYSEDPSVYKDGVKFNGKHGKSKISKHETCKTHILAANIYMQHSSSKTVDSLLDKEQNLLRLKNIKMNQEVVKRIISWILFIGRQGIAYRGTAESLKNFRDTSVNHGNFLEILRTASQHDVLLQNHLDKCVEKAEIVGRSSDSGPVGRGSAVSFLSKTTVNKLIHIIGSEMTKMICEDVKKAGIYSIMCDSTQDILGHEQCAIVIRYINPNTFNVEERLLGIIRLYDTSGEGYFDAVTKFLRDLGIDLSLMVGCSFDGASNMRSDLVGLQVRLKELNNDLLYTWDYAHVLNLVVTDCAESALSARKIFGLLQTTHNFFSASYKRVGEWEKLTAKLHGNKKLVRLESLGKTRWYSKDKALLKIFGSFSKPSTEVYQTLLEFLRTIKNSAKFDPKVSLEAGFLLESWTKIETLLTGFTFLKIFEIIGPTSKYFQTRGLDLFAAWQMLQSSMSKIQKVRSLFDNIKDKAVTFAKQVNEAVLLAKETNEDVFAEAVNEDCDDFFVEEEFPPKRIRRIKRLPGEKASDEPIEDSWDNYRINQFLVISDSISQGLKNRYSDHGNNELIQEMVYFHPRKFKDLSDEDFNLQYLSRVLKIDEFTLIQELKDFADTYTNLVEPSKNENTFPGSDEESESDNGESESEDDGQHKCEHTSKSAKTQCNNCIKCCFQFLLKFNFHVSAFVNVFRVYEYFLTLPCAQIECERVFSRLKIVKSRLRSSVKQDLLEPLVLMNKERDLTFRLDIDKILHLFASSTTELKRYLIE